MRVPGELHDVRSHSAALGTVAASPPYKLAPCGYPLTPTRMPAGWLPHDPESRSVNQPMEKPVALQIFSIIAATSACAPVA